MRITAAFGTSYPLLRDVGVLKFKCSRLVVYAEKGKEGKGGKSISFGDKLLDYIEGGPKLRKWYGAPDQTKSAKYFEEETEETSGGVRDAVLVTDADSETGQLVVMSLILKRSRVRVLVRDAKLATTAFGSYVEPIVGNVNDRQRLVEACRGVCAIICPTKLGALADKKLLKGIEHIVYLSELRTTGLQFLLRPGASQQAVKDESTLAELGIPYTILRPGLLIDEPGGQLGFEIKKVDENKKDINQQVGSISREDAAMLCVKALDARPEKSLVLEVANANTELRNPETVFASLVNNC